MFQTLVDANRLFTANCLVGKPECAPSFEHWPSMQRFLGSPNLACHGGWGEMAVVFGFRTILRSRLEFLLGFGTSGKVKGTLVHSKGRFFCCI